MKYSNEFKVGIAIILAIAVFVFGIRIFQDLPLFRGTYDLYTTFDNAGGLVEGNAVRVNGISVGAVESVGLDPENNVALVRFHLDEGLQVPEGSYTQIGGLSLFATVYLELHLGPRSGRTIAENGMVPSRSDDLFGKLTKQAPGLVDRLDSTLTSINTTFDEASGLIGDPDRELQQTLVALRRSANGLDRLLRAEQERLSAVLDNMAGLTGDLRAFTAESGDSLSIAVHNLNRVLSRLNGNLLALEGTTARLDTLLVKVNRGDGTLGRLVNDPGLYVKLDSAATGLNTLIRAFNEDPGRFLKEMTLVDIF